MAKFPTYTVAWSEEDAEFVATCDWMPSLSWMARDVLEAFAGLLRLLEEDLDALVSAGQEFNRVRADG